MVRFRFGGLRLADLDLDGAVAWITAQADARRPTVVVTPNINHLHLVETVPRVREAIAEADVQLADGWPLVAASRVLRQRLPERIAGIDLVERLVESPRSFSLAILGGPADTADRLAQRARGVNDVVLVDALPPGWDEPVRLAQLLQRVQAARPDLVLIGIGAPRQELLAHDLKRTVRGPILCCGAAIEVLAGFRPRAPRFLQLLGLEWAFRLAIEPRRLLRRYLVSGTTFLRVLAREALKLRLRGGEESRRA